MKKKLFKLLPCIALIFACSLLPAVYSAAGTQLVDSGMDCAENIDSLSNPERGFYSARGLGLSKEGNTALNPTANLVHLRFGLQSVSPVKNDGEELELTQPMLNTVNKTLANIRKNGGTAILRFAYDNFNGYADREPSLDMILTHISQLSPSFNEYEDVIAGIEMGFIGPWGEMHTSKMASYSNYDAIIDALLAAAPESIGITVRRPAHYAHWAGVSIADINTDVTVKGTHAYRVGVFNDGYLGTYNDMGTYVNREKEVTWLSNQAKHTLFGGEAVLVGNRDYNNIDFISEEMFKTHTSYLNATWNDTLIGYWKNEEVYTGADELYNGQTAYKYISDHLGYRFSFASCLISESVELGGTFETRFTVRNTGCGNVVKPKYAQLIFEQNASTYAVDIDVDAREWNSLEISAETVKAALPAELSEGECTVYIRLSNARTAQRSIAFANSGVWNIQLGANKLGTFTVVPAEEPTDPATDPATDPTGEPDDGKSFWDSIVEFFERIIEFFKSLFNR